MTPITVRYWSKRVSAFRMRGFTKIGRSPTKRFSSIWSTVGLPSNAPLEEVVAQEKVFRGAPELRKPISMIAADERDHLRYCHEELLRFAQHGYGDVIRSMLKEYALVEIQTYRDVSVAVMTRIGWILGWPKWKIRLLTVGIYAIYRGERAWTWRRMTTLRPPTRHQSVGIACGGGLTHPWRFQRGIHE